ncbi:hypothetical protein BOV89_03950, partial [Solemya velum gill symbiont]
AFVFPQPNGERVERLNNSGWRTAWKKAKLPMEGCKRGVHNLRHTFGERLEVAGVPEWYRKALLGHEINDVTALYSAPGLAKMLEMAEMVQRKSVRILRPVTHNLRTVEKRKATGGR